LLILDIEPLGSPSLDGIIHLEVEILCFGAHRDDGGPQWESSILGGIASDEEDLLSETPMGINAEEALAQRDETCDVQDRFWCQLMQIDIIHKDKPKEEFSGRERKTSIEERNKKYPETDIRAWHNLIARDHDIRHPQEHPGFLELIQVTGGETRSRPARRFLLLQCGVPHRGPIDDTLGPHRGGERAKT
jgi:hypothetical protein